MFKSKVTERLLEAIDNGTAPWMCPWEAAPPEEQYNAVTGKPYRGANQLLLSMCSPNLADGRWLTFNQAKAKGWHVRKGETGSPIEFYTMHRSKKVTEKNEDGKEETKTIIVEMDRPVLKSYTVFHASQIEGIPPLDVSSPGYEWNANARAEAIVAASGAIVLHDQGRRAFYRPSTDAIHMPSKDRFPTSEDYYSTLLHELAHWTGHETRQNRGGAKHGFGSPEYGLEELRAEIASYFLCVDLGLPITQEHVDNHGAYLRSWRKTVKDPVKELASAIRDATKIRDMIMEFDREHDVGKETEIEIEEFEPAR